MKNEKNKKGLIVIFLCVVALVVLCIIDGKMGNKTDDKSKPDTKSKKTTETVKTTENTGIGANTNIDSNTNINTNTNTRINTASDADEPAIDIDTKKLTPLKNVKYMDIFYWEKFRLEGSRIRLKEGMKNEHIIKTLDSLITDDTTESISPELLNISLEIEVYDEDNNKIASYEIQDDILEIKTESKKYKLNTDDIGTLTQYIKNLNLTN